MNEIMSVVTMLTAMPQAGMRYEFSLGPVEKTPIRIEYAKMAAGYLHLSWERRSQEIEHVPTACLYPAPAAG
jgi:hypothetical protein